MSNIRSSIPDFLRAQAFEPDEDDAVYGLQTPCSVTSSASVANSSVPRSFSDRRSDSSASLFDSTADFTQQRWKESPSDAMERELMNGLDAHYVRSGKKDMIERSVSMLGVAGPMSPLSPTSTAGGSDGDAEAETQQHSRKERSLQFRKRDGFENSFSGAALETGATRPTQLPPGSTFASPGYISGPTTFPGSSTKPTASRIVSRQTETYLPSFFTRLL